MRILLYLLVLGLLLPLNAVAKSKFTKAQFGVRSYEIEIPDGDKAQPFSVVFVLRGGGGSTERFRKYFDFNKLAGTDDVAFLSGMDTFAHWQGVNGCTEKYETLKMANTYVRDETRTVKYIGTCEHPTEMIRIINGGHNIPMFKPGVNTKSKKYKRRKKIIGRYNHDFDGRAEIWGFFKRAGF